jgi:hypothetical protein
LYEKKSPSVFRKQTGFFYAFLCCDRIALLFLHTEEELPDIHVQLDTQFIITIYVNTSYLKEHHKILYHNLLTQCKLIDHLADINEEAQNMYDRLVKQLAEQEGVTEKLKGKDLLGWVAKMNNINSRASEIVFAETIYTV